jgi:aminopeptidase N
VVRVVQAQDTQHETGLFSLPVEFAFHTPRGEKRFKEMVEKKSHLFRFKLDAEPSLALFDPDHWLLKRVDFPKSEALWARQLTDDPHAIGRAEAAKALGALGTRSAVEALAAAIGREKFWYAQGAIAQALGQAATAEAVQALRRAHQKLEHPKARRMLIAAMGEARDPSLHDLLRETHGREKSYFAFTQSLRSLARRGDPAVRALLDEALAADSWNDVIASGALEALTALKPDDLIAVLLRHAAYGRPHTRRMTAVRCLGQVGAGRDDVRRRLIRLLNDPYLLVQLAVVKALAQVGDERAIPALKKLTQGDLDGRLIRSAEEAVLKLGKGIEDDKKS